MKSKIRSWSLGLATGLLLTNCAQLHSAKIGERRLPPENATPFDSKVNEIGFNMQEATEVVKMIGQGNTKVNEGADTLQTLWDLISFGPKTGNTVFDDKYADESGKVSRLKCSPEKTVGVVSYRETRKYPVLSGEIVKIEGLCK
jgi:hypothetical protein